MQMILVAEDDKATGDVLQQALEDAALQLVMARVVDGWHVQGSVSGSTWCF